MGMQSGIGTRVRSGSAKESGTISKAMQGKVGQGTESLETRKLVKSVKKQYNLKFLGLGRYQSYQRASEPLVKHILDTLTL